MKAGGLFSTTLQDMVEAVGSSRGAASPFARAALALPALFFTHGMERFNRDCEALGVREASRRLLLRFYGGAEAFGAPVPVKGPLLLISNHPGIVDSLSLLSLLPRDDWHLVANASPFFRSLRSIWPRVIPVPEDRAGRANTLRTAAARLREGRLVLLYPAGEIEPDPAVHGGASWRKTWVGGIDWLLREAAKGGFDFQVQCLAVSGIFSHRVLASPLLRWKKEVAERERLAVFLILLTGAMRNDPVRLDFGPALDGKSLMSGGKDSARLLLEDQMDSLLRKSRAIWSEGEDSE